MRTGSSTPMVRRQETHIPLNTRLPIYHVHCFLDTTIQLTRTALHACYAVLQDDDKHKPIGHTYCYYLL